MRRRVFIAINPPKEITAKISRSVEELGAMFDEDAVRFSPPENWHITVNFLGSQDEQEINLILQAMRTVAEEFTAPEIQLEKISYGPSDMIWITGDHETSKELGKLQNRLWDVLNGLSIRFKEDRRAFNAHITIGKVTKFIESLPKIEKKFNAEFTPITMDLMESTQGNIGSQYDILSSFAFRETT